MKEKYEHIVFTNRQIVSDTNLVKSTLKLGQVQDSTE